MIQERTSWWSRMGTLFSRYPAHLTTIDAKLFRDVPVRARKFAGKQLAGSTVLHACAFLLLPFFLKYIPKPTPHVGAVSNDQQIVYYHLADPQKKLKAPTVQQPGPGSNPGSGTARCHPPEDSFRHPGFFGSACLRPVLSSDKRRWRSRAGR